MKLLNLGFFLIFFGLFACKKAELVKPSIVELNESAEDIQVPTKMFPLIKDVLGKDFKTDPEYLYTSIAVEFYSTQNVLTQERVQFKFPNGGGQIDLAELVSGQGSFYMSFPEEQFNKGQLLFIKLFYISNSPKIKIGHDEYGLGCGKMADLTPQIKNLQNPTFLKLNSTNKSYINVLAGNYIMVYQKGVQFYLSHLKVTDSRFKDQLCDSLFSKL